MKNKNSRPRAARNPMRKRKRSEVNVGMIVGILGAICALLLFAALKSNAPTSTVTANNSNEIEAVPYKTEVREAKPVVQSEPEMGKAEPSTVVRAQRTENVVETSITVQEAEVRVERSMQDIKVQVRQLTIERKWDEALALCVSYQGTLKIEADMLRREVLAKKADYEDMLAARKASPTQVAKKSKSIPEKKPNIFENREKKKAAFERDDPLKRDEKKAKAQPVNLVVHSKLVGLPKNMIVVWKERKYVLSYSRLIKALENKSSRFFDVRVEKAKQFLKDNSAFYELIPFRNAKMTLRRKGYTVSEVFFNQTFKDGYDKRTERFKGFIISYDIKPPEVSGGFSMGC